MNAPIYLDHSATTPVHPEVLEAMLPFFGPRFGNPSSVHRWGREARTAVADARERIARCLGAQPDEVSFVSCGTEGDNLAILGTWRAARGTPRAAVVTTPIEHKAILGAVHQAAREGAVERILTVDANGVVESDSFDALVLPDVAVCSVMWVNNETGTMQSVPELGARARDRGVVFHTDAVQAFGKVKIDATTQAFDLLTISGHKIGAPKGIGAVYVRRGTQVEPILHGGSQERGRRSGTENVAYCVGLARAAEIADAERDVEVARLERLRDELEAVFLREIPGAVIHARSGPRAPHIVNVSFPDTDSDSMLMALDLAGIAASAGSACQSGSTTPSHVLSAIGVRPDLAACAVRFSLGSLTTDDAIDRAGRMIPALVAKARGLTGVPA
jgi:cysteine desulfurase